MLLPFLSDLVLLHFHCLVHGFDPTLVAVKHDRENSFDCHSELVREFRGIGARVRNSRAHSVIDAFVFPSHRRVLCQRFAATDVAHPPAFTIDFRRGNIKNVIWATGYRPDYSWLHVPVLDRKGQLRHEGGVVHAPGLYAMGLPYMRRHKSSFIHGAADDARDITTHLAAYLSHRDQPWLSASS